MNAEYSLLMQKPDETFAKDLETDFGMMLTSMPMLLPTERKDVEKNDWADEDGEDVYMPKRARMKAFDIELGIVYLGTMALMNRKYSELLTYLLEGGTELKIYNKWVGMGRKGVMFVKMTTPEYGMTGRQDKPFAYQWKMTLRVTDPVTEISASTGLDKKYHLD